MIEELNLKVYSESTRQQSVCEQLEDFCEQQGISRESLLAVLKETDVAQEVRRVAKRKQREQEPQRHDKLPP